MVANSLFVLWINNFIIKQNVEYWTKSSTLIIDLTLSLWNGFAGFESRNQANLFRLNYQRHCPQESQRHFSGAQSGADRWCMWCHQIHPLWGGGFTNWLPEFEVGSMIDLTWFKNNTLWTYRLMFWLSNCQKHKNKKGKLGITKLNANSAPNRRNAFGDLAKLISFKYDEDISCSDELSKRDEFRIPAMIRRGNETLPKGTLDLTRLLEAEEKTSDVLFQIPNAEWLVDNGWIDAQDKNNGPFFVKKMQVQFLFRLYLTLSNI